MNTERNVSKKYPSLRIIAYVQMVYAICVGSVVLLSAIYLFTENQILLGLAFLIGGGCFALILAGISEAIRVAIDIEFNTRRSSLDTLAELYNKPSNLLTIEDKAKLFGAQNKL